MSTAKSALTPSFSKLEIAITTSALAPVCAWVTLSPANRAITKGEIHNTWYFAFIAVLLFPHEDLFSQHSLTQLLTSHLSRRTSPPLDSNFLELLGASCGGGTSSKAVRLARVPTNGS